MSVIAIVCPLPSSELDPLLAAALTLGDVLVIAPWAQRSPTFVRKRVAFAHRRHWPRGGVVRRVPGWPALEGVGAFFTRGRTDRRIAWNIGVRGAVDRWAASQLRRVKGLTAVIAPSLGARHVFAAVQNRDQPPAKILWEDLPNLRILHRDLDRGAKRHPDCPFLRRYRAPGESLAKQAAEWALADVVLCRGRYAQQLHRERDGEAFLLPLSFAVPRRVLAPRPCGERLALLAGGSTARCGTPDILAALDADPALSVIVRPTEGTEPVGLLRHPRVIVRADTANVGCVVCPAYCETYPPEIRMASANHIPVVGTLAGAGFVPLSKEVPVGDPDALAAGIASASECPLPVANVPDVEQVLRVAVSF